MITDLSVLLVLTISPGKRNLLVSSCQQQQINITHRDMQHLPVWLHSFHTPAALMRALPLKDQVFPIFTKGANATCSCCNIVHGLSLQV